jgi:hypothetical protein
VIWPSPGRSNSSFQPFSALPVPLLIVYVAPQPVPQSWVTVNWAATEPAPMADATGMIAAVTAIAAPAIRPMRTERLMRSPGVSLYRKLFRKYS